MHVDDPLHRRLVGKADVVEEAAAQERVGQLLLVVAGDHDDRPVAGRPGLAGLVDVELHAVELAQQVVREFDVGLVDLVDQQYRLHVAGESLPQRSLHDVIADFRDARIAELRIAQPRHRIVLVQSLRRPGGRLDVPLEQRLVERAGNLHGEQRLAGAGLALDQQRPRQQHGRVDGRHQLLGRDVAVRAPELPAHAARCSRISTAGSFLPSTNSRNAPPPVEM